MIPVGIAAGVLRRENKIYVRIEQKEHKIT